MSLTCPGCKADIDEDSFHCDQCGAELMKCGMCGYTGKGKMCPHDRTPLLPAKALAPTRGSTANPLGAAAAPSQAPAQVPPVSSSAPAPDPVAAPSVSPPALVPAAAALRALCLRHGAHGLVLRPAPGDVLGRRFGPHAAQLAQFAQISSNHLRLQCDGAGQWLAQDMNSFNGSFYNGRKLAPGQDQRLDAGATLVLGDVAFSVEFE
jgi:predicted RNA-binding Zn-ribbon protein involved in translation (DUF1610 family)